MWRQKFSNGVEWLLSKYMVLCALCWVKLDYMQVDWNSCRNMWYLDKRDGDKKKIVVYVVWGVSLVPGDTAEKKPHANPRFGVLDVLGHFTSSFGPTSNKYHLHRNHWTQQLQYTQERRTSLSRIAETLTTWELQWGKVACPGECWSSIASSALGAKRSHEHPKRNIEPNTDWAGNPHWKANISAGEFSALQGVQVCCQLENARRSGAYVKHVCNVLDEFISSRHTKLQAG
jgi:hypothetical protein